jgi:hypothetical protein
MGYNKKKEKRAEYMNWEKELKRVGIVPIRSLRPDEKNYIIRQFVQRLQKIYDISEQEYNRIFMKMNNCPMYLSEINGCLGKANYFYKNQSIYFDQSLDLENVDEVVLHECIHYFQDCREKDGALNRIGLCEFREFSVNGLGLNEAAVQYIVSDMLEKKEEEVEIYGIKLKTKSPTYYPIMCNLMQQIIYLVGEETVFNSTLYNKNELEEWYFYYCGDSTLNSIKSKFDAIIEEKQKLKESEVRLVEQLQWQGIKQKVKDEQSQWKIRKLYEETQREILISYFDRSISFTRNYRRSRRI